MKGMKEDYYSSRAVHSAVPQKDFSNKAVLIMLVVVIVVTLAGLVMYLNVLSQVTSDLNSVPAGPPPTTQLQQAPQSYPSSQAVVGLTILPQENIPGANP